MRDAFLSLFEPSVLYQPHRSAPLSTRNLARTFQHVKQSPGTALARPWYALVSAVDHFTNTSGEAVTEVVCWLSSRSNRSAPAPYSPTWHSTRQFHVSHRPNVSPPHYRVHPCEQSSTDTSAPEDSSIHLWTRSTPSHENIEFSSPRCPVKLNTVHTFARRCVW